MMQELEEYKCISMFSVRKRVRIWYSFVFERTSAAEDDYQRDRGLFQVTGWLRLDNKKYDLFVTIVGTVVGY